MQNPTEQRPTHPRLRARYRRALRFFASVLINVAFWDLLLRRVGFRSLARRNAPARYRRAAQRYRALAVELGGVWIKVGQFLSARVDVLPEAITAELAGLQDEVAAEPAEAMLRVVEAEFGSPVEEVFPWFEQTPLASASLGQVHRARLPSGEQVVVKVQRPDIQDLLHVDLQALQTVIGWLKRYRPISRRVDLDALYREFSRTLWEEVDYISEAENARRFGVMFAEDSGVRIPGVHAAHSTERVLTLEDVYFIKITDYDSIEAAGVDRGEVAERLFRTYLRQIFREGFFHADPHPGNLFVEPLGDGNWRLVFVDFGMVGHLTPDAMAGLRELAIGVGARDAERLVRAYQRLGVLLPSADLVRIRQAEQAMFDRLWGLSMRELVQVEPREMRQVAHQFRDVIYEMPFQLPTDLIFLGRCVAILQGMCTGLDPEFNVFLGLAPFARRLLEEESGEGWEALLDWLIEQGEALLRAPARLDAALSRIERGDLEVTARPSIDLARRLAYLTRMVDRLVGAVIFSAVLLAGTLLYTSGEQTLGGAAFLVAAALLLIWVLRRPPP